MFLCCRRAGDRWRPHHHLPRVLRLQRSARGRLPQCSNLPDQHPQVLTHTIFLLELSSHNPTPALLLTHSAEWTLMTNLVQDLYLTSQTLQHYRSTLNMT